MPETMKVFWSTEEKIINDQNGENVPKVEITEVALVHCNIVSNQYQHDSVVLSTFYLCSK